MKFIIPTQEFNFLVSKCLNIISVKPTTPILGNMLIEAANGLLTITATDLSVGIRCFAEAKILEEGATTLPAKKLAQLLRELTSFNTEFTSNDREITEIFADSSRFKLHGMSAKTFPSLPDMSGATRFTIKQSAIKEMFYRTSFAVSRDDNRYVLTGVHMNITNGMASFSGTDGKRLSMTRTQIPVDTAFSGSYIIPLKAVEEILKNLTDEGDANISLLFDKIAIETANTTIIAKLLTGDYPDISRVIPEQTGTIVALHREELMSLLRQVSLFTEDSSHSVRFSFSEGELNLSANTAEIGEGKVSMPVNFQGQKLDIAFNPAFFLDILRHTKEETVSMSVLDPYTPGVITDVGQLKTPLESSSLFVLMPMRLSEDMR